MTVVNALFLFQCENKSTILLILEYANHAKFAFCKATQCTYLERYT